MITIIAGSRDIDSKREVRAAIAACGWRVTKVISGGANGVDKRGEQYARDKDLPMRRFLADWRRYGRGAGAVRNAEMAEHAEALIAIWDGISPGTKNMIAIARKKGLRVYVHIINKSPNVFDVE